MVGAIVFCHNVSPEKARLSLWKQTFQTSIWDALDRWRCGL
jgi:hypothetical protein